MFSADPGVPIAMNEIDAEVAVYRLEIVHHYLERMNNYGFQ